MNADANSESRKERRRVWTFYGRDLLPNGQGVGIFPLDGNSDNLSFINCLPGCTPSGLIPRGHGRSGTDETFFQGNSNWSDSSLQETAKKHFANGDCFKGYAISRLAYSLHLYFREKPDWDACSDFLAQSIYFLRRGSLRNSGWCFELLGQTLREAEWVVEQKISTRSKSLLLAQLGGWLNEHGYAEDGGSLLKEVSRLIRDRRVDLHPEDLSAYYRQLANYYMVRDEKGEIERVIAKAEDCGDASAHNRYGILTTLAHSGKTYPDYVRLYDRFEPDFLNFDARTEYGFKPLPSCNLDVNVPTAINTIACRDLLLFRLDKKPGSEMFRAVVEQEQKGACKLTFNNNPLIKAQFEAESLGHEGSEFCLRRLAPNLPKGLSAQIIEVAGKC